MPANACRNLWIVALIALSSTLVLPLAETASYAQDKASALLKAAKEDRVDDMQRFLKEGASVNAADDRGYTALIWVSGRGNAAAARNLLEAGANVNAKTVDNVTALIRAAAWGRLDVVKLLVERGADLNVKGKDGWTAAEAASLFGHEEVKRYLLQHGAKEK